MLDEAGLAHGDVRVVSSPRRLAAIVSDVAYATEAVHEVKRGPKAQIAFDADGNPTKAAAGFARKCGIDASELTRKVDEDGNEYVFATRTFPLSPQCRLLSALGHDVIAAIEWPNYRSRAGAPSTRPSFARFAGSCAHPRLRGPARYLRRRDEPQRHPRPSRSGAWRACRCRPTAYEQVLKDSYVLGVEAREAAIREGIAAIEAERPAATWTRLPAYSTRS